MKTWSIHQKAGALVLLGTSIFAIWWMTRPNSLRAASESMTRAAAAGDGQKLFEYCSDTERSCSSLTPEILRKALELMLGEPIQKSSLVRVEPGVQSSNEVQATSTARYLDTKGTPWTMTFIANQTGTTPKTPVLYAMLTTACQFDDNGNVVLEPTIKHQLAVIRKLRPSLEAIGIKKILVSAADCASWDALESKYAQAAGE